MCTKPAFLERKIGPHLLSLYLSPTNNHFSATIQNPSGSLVHIDPSQIKCGISGKVSHQDFIRRVDQIGREKLAAFVYSSEGQTTEVWVFEASPLAAPWIKNAKKHLKQDQFDEAINQLETALKLEQQQKGDTAEKSSTTLELKKELFMLRALRAQKDAHFYLSPEESAVFMRVIEVYEDQDNPFHSLAQHLEGLGLESPHLYYLSALLNEHQGKIVEAAPQYLYLALNHPSPLHCLKKAAEIIKGASDSLALPHFLERLDREWLIQLAETTQDPELERWVLVKDALRMTFENCLVELSRSSTQTQLPTCFICFNGEEADVEKWLEQTLVPDLDRMGVKPLFCSRGSGPGKELNNFQALIRHADQVIFACTPELKRICEERKKAPTGVAQEVRIARERYNDPDKYETIFPLYLRGDRKASCPSEFFEPILGTNFTCLDKSSEMSVFSYYAQAFELLGGMRQIPREHSRRMKEAFIEEAKRIIDGKSVNVEQWRNSRAATVTAVLKSTQERVSLKTQMVNLPQVSKDFTGRERELKGLHEACLQKSRVAVTGLGGIGKTALALKYANDYRLHYQFIHFMPAGTPQLVIDGLLKLADDLHIPKTDKSEERLLWLKTALNRFEHNYLLIFDGLDQIEAFEEAAKYLPQRGHCLLLTTRMPQQSKIRDFELIELNPFTLEEAVNYLLKATGSQEAAAKALAEKLGRLPLALTHAARYIDSQKITIQRYIELFNQYELKLFEKEYVDLPKEEKTVLTTWKISIDAIENTHQCPLGKEILEMSAFLDQAPIPRELIESWFKESHPESSKLELGKAIRYLCGYSMISSPEANVYSVHLMVQRVTQYPMPSERKQKVFELVLNSVSEQMVQFKDEDTTTWALPRLCLPHALHLFETSNLLLGYNLESQYQFTILLNDINRTFGNAHQTLKINKRCLDISTQWKAKDPSNSKSQRAFALSLNNTGLALLDLGNAKEALENFQQVYTIWHDLYEESHPDVATCLSNIGLALKVLGKANEALNYQYRALKIRLARFGESHPEVAASHNHIGGNLQVLGRAAEALESLRKALKIYQDLHGKSHPTVAMSQNNIGMALEELGKFEEALQSLYQALKIHKDLFGESHLHVAMGLNNIGMALQALGKVEEALENFRQAYKILQALYGESHPLVATSLNNIGMVLQALGKADEALGNFRQAYKILHALYGESHPLVAKGLYNIGTAQRDLGEANKALLNLRQAHKILHGLYGESHPEVALFLNNIGLSLQSMGEVKKALETFRRAHKALHTLYGNSHPDVLLSLNNIGSALLDLGETEEALSNFYQAYRSWHAQYGEYHPDVAISLNNIGMTLALQSKFEKALEYFRQAYKIRQALYGTSHPDAGKSLKSIGKTLLVLERNEEALRSFQQALDILLPLLGPLHPYIQSIRADMLSITPTSRSGSQN